MNREKAVYADQIKAGYGRKEVLHDLTFAIPTGEWCVLLGPNGSGKTTLMKTLMGMLKPSGGEASVLGHSCFTQSREMKKHIGYIPEEPYFYLELNAIQHFRFAGDMHCVPKQKLAERMERMLEIFELRDVSRQRLSKYSLGMKRKVGLGMALIHSPKVLILDEPFNGLDPITSGVLRKLLRGLCDRQRLTIFMSTHNLGMMHEYCDRMIIINDGNILARTTPAVIAKKFPGKSVEEVFLKLVNASRKPKNRAASK